MQRAGGTGWLQLFDWLADRLGVPGAIVAVLLLGLAYLLVKGWRRAPAERSAAAPSDKDNHEGGRTGEAAPPEA